MLSGRCPVLFICNRATLVYCGQMVGWIKMRLGTEVGLGPGDIVLDEDPAPPRKGAQQAPPVPTFRPTLLWHDCLSQQLLSFYFWILIIPFYIKLIFFELRFGEQH